MTPQRMLANASFRPLESEGDAWDSLEIVWSNCEPVTAAEIGFIRSAPGRSSEVHVVDSGSTSKRQPMSTPPYYGA